MQRNALMSSKSTIKSQKGWPRFYLLSASSTAALFLAQGYYASPVEARTQVSEQGRYSSHSGAIHLAQSEAKGISWPWRRSQSQATPKVTSAQRRRPKPPSQGTYVTRRGGASRSCGDGKSPVALVPTEQLGSSDELLPKLSTGGFTTQPKPEFWFEIPFEPEAVETLEFVLQNSEDQDIYRGAVAPQKGLVKMTLPEEIEGLEVGDRYRWFLKAEVRCPISDAPEKLDSKASLQQVKGWIERYEATASLRQKLQAASPQQQAHIYADAGIWFDAMNLLMQLQQEGPADTSLQNDWAMLLNIYGLDADSLSSSNLQTES